MTHYGRIHPVQQLLDGVGGVGQVQVQLLALGRGEVSQHEVRR